MKKNKINRIFFVIIIGLMFVLVGSVGVSAISATGGTITTYSDGGVNYKVHTFTSSGTFTVTESGDLEVLVVAGGGAGGFGGYAEPAGGGGAGGLIYDSSYAVSSSQEISIIVGAGGQDSGSASTNGENGGNSIFGTLTAIGGGGGVSGGSPPVASSGGSGGGGNGYVQKNPGDGTVGQGYAGGFGFGVPSYSGGGGGGASEVGANGANQQGGVGGDGIQYSISGTPTYYAGGGGGAGWTAGVHAYGGLGGGGEGGKYGSRLTGVSATANTGGGGGGAANGAVAGNGGSGIVIIRYIIGVNFEISNPQPANNSILAFGTTNTTLGVSTNINANCKYSTSIGQAFSSMTPFTISGGTFHNSLITGLTNGGDYDYYIKCNDTSTANITDDYHIHFNVSDTGTYNLNFGIESDWIQEDDINWTNFDGGEIKLHQIQGSIANIANEATITKIGGVGTLSGLVDGNKVSYSWDDTASANEGVVFTFSSTKNVSSLIVYSSDSYPVHGLNFYVDGSFEASTSDTISSISPWIVNFSTPATGTEFKIIRPNTGWDQTLSEIELYGYTLAYPIIPYYIYSNNAQIDTSSWSVIKSVTTTETTPTDTSIKYLLSFDGRSNWKYWTGSAWATSILNDLQMNGMSKTTLQAITESQWSSGFSAGTLDFAIDLGTTNSANTPELSGITIQYSEGVVACVDIDNDGYGAEGTNLTQCDNPTVPDCNDNNADINPEAYDIVGNGIDEDCSGSDASYNFSIETEFLYPSGTSTYYVGDDIWYQITIRRNGVLYDPPGIKLNLTNHYGIIYDSHTKSDMTHVSAGVYKGYFDSTSFDNSVPDIRYDIWIYGSMNEQLDYNVHYDFTFPDGTAPSIISTEYTYFTNAISNHTVKDFAVNSSEAKIDWSESTLDLHERDIDLDSALIMADKVVYLNSSAYSELNNSAILTFYNVDCASPYVFYSETESTRDTIFAEDNQCLAPRCTDIECSGSTLTVTVSSFSGYAAEADVSLTIDADDPKLVGQEVHFTADYRNLTDDSFITGATCTIYFTDGNYPMAEGAIYTYNRTFVTEGLKDYNVTCSKTEFSTLTAYDNATITSAEIPEFSILTLGLGLVAVLIGLVIIRRKR